MAYIQISLNVTKLSKILKENPEFIEQNKPDLCASIQQTIVSILMTKMKSAINATGIYEIAIAGGVSANSGLRHAIQSAGEKAGWNVYIPPIHYTTDNAAMIAISGYFKYLQKDFSDQSATPYARSIL